VSIHRLRRRLVTSMVLTIVPLLAPLGEALAQTATVDFTNQKQYIRGFGGMVHIPWIGDLSASERTLAFGNADGQLGFTILRIAVPDGSTSTSSYVATAKAAIAAGGIVFASPWNSSGSMSSSEFASYADHLSSFVSYMKGQGAELYAISVQNEPDYATQSGWRAWTAAQCHDFVLNYGDKIGTKLMSCESFNYTKSLYDPILNDSAALAKLGVLGTHLYGTPVNGYPYALFDQKAAGKIERWMTEHYTDSNTDANAWPNALNVATEMHNAMVEAQFNAYVWWYIKRSYGPINNGAITKRGWCMAHWSKFVRPGFYRVDATKSPTSGVSVSAFKGDSEVAIVLVNTATSSKSVTLSINGSSIASYDKFTTSSSKSLASDGAVTASNGSLSVTLDAQSVTTLHGKGTVSPPSGAGGATGAGGVSGAGGAGAGGASGTGSTLRRDAGVGSDASDAGGTGGVIGNRDAGPGAGGSSGPNASGGIMGSGGAGGAATGGSATGGTESSRGGASGTGGTTDETVRDVGPDNGCSCRIGRSGAGADRGLKLALLLLGAALWTVIRRRRL
jgi:glucuronoarabinoxylan endo-1,4-beta-xylanase